MPWTDEDMAREVIAFFEPWQCVNLGIGLPTRIASLIPANLPIMFHSENGVLGVRGYPKASEVSPTRINAGKETIAIRAGASYFDSSLSFGMIRGGHVDHAVLGGMQVDVDGSLANWKIPGQKITGMGGAMDLVHGARRVIVMMKHFTKDRTAKLLPRVTLPLTGFGVVHTVVTDLGVFAPQEGRFTILRLAPGVQPSDLGIDSDLVRAV